MYRPVISTEDSLHLQKDLDRVFKWTQHWQLQLNIQKCVALRCTRSHFPKISNYTINGHFLELKHQHSYLGLTINGTMQWSPHINNQPRFLKYWILSGVIWVLAQPQQRPVLICPYSLPYNGVCICLLCLGSPRGCTYPDPWKAPAWRAARWVLSHYGKQSNI